MKLPAKGWLKNLPAVDGVPQTMWCIVGDTYILAALDVRLVVGWKDPVVFAKTTMVAAAPTC